MIAPVDTTEMDRAEAEAKRRFSEKAEEFRQNLEDKCFDLLPGNHSPAETVMLAHLMTAIDGYNDVETVREWNEIPKSGFQTTLVYLADAAPSLILAFGLECRCGQTARQLAIEIDHDRPAERLPAKLQRETALIARGFRVMSFSETEILTAPEACRERVETVLCDMIEQVMTEENGWAARPGS
ncbi:PDDEXK family nuclease [Shumkonia mesophila]|uniref:hypothetical protein n=1 Tax=Shumkonia mesophila TaxID=2838854 RepID=UPI002934C9F6|nr:hypothetical protein [Shumkonia mesophila]